ncbi:transporter substrate-binding domain-containing protein [Shewanella cyperi]|uniref:transporter substrate-binding domain-containing protein n=1 Tax=Shewanella cyperi TaxID=2814292 RepID=UPI001A941799|nr:transporter substrate-binding domain-containing protein [Shewanella cyperi]QSX42687.1 transporter substrate-binding domain-containing protein [Shewanella cyperi]
MAEPGGKTSPQVRLKYNVSGSSNWYPYYIPNSPDSPGIISELLPQILSRAGVGGEIVPLPPKRTNQALENGQLDFDIVSPSWFPNGDFGPKFVKSSPIMLIKENVITLPGHELDWQDISAIKGREIGTVMGYLYHDDKDFIRADFRSEQELIKALHKHRIPAAISGDYPALYWSAKLNLPIAIAAEHSSGDLVFRLRKEHEALLPAIDAAITELKKDGTIKTIIAKYTQRLQP